MRLFHKLMRAKIEMTAAAAIATAVGINNRAKNT